jgi:hypothetical protein
VLYLLIIIGCLITMKKGTEKGKVFTFFSALEAMSEAVALL